MGSGRGKDPTVIWTRRLVLPAKRVIVQVGGVLEPAFGVIPHGAEALPRAVAPGSDIGAFVHKRGTSLMSRGDRREAIYGNNVDRRDFFKTLGGKNGKRMNRR